MNEGFDSRKASLRFKKSVHSLRFPFEVEQELREANHFEFRSGFDPKFIFHIIMQHRKYSGYEIWGGIDLQTSCFSELNKFSSYLSLLTESRVSAEVSELSFKLRTTADEEGFVFISELLMRDLQARIDSFPIIRSMQEYLEFMLPYFEISAENCFEALSTKDLWQAELPGGKNLEVRFGSKYFYGTIALCAWLANALQHDVARQRQRLLDVLHLPMPKIPDGCTIKDAFQINRIFGVDRQDFINRAAPLFGFEPFKCEYISGLPMLKASTGREPFKGFDMFLGMEGKLV